MFAKNAGLYAESERQITPFFSPKTRDIALFSSKKIMGSEQGNEIWAKWYYSSLIGGIKTSI